MNQKLNQYFLQFSKMSNFKIRESEIMYFCDKQLNSAHSDPDIEIMQYPPKSAWEQSTLLNLSPLKFGICFDSIQIKFGDLDILEYGPHKFCVGTPNIIQELDSNIKPVTIKYKLEEQRVEISRNNVDKYQITRLNSDISIFDSDGVTISTLESNHDHECILNLRDENQIHQIKYVKIL